MISADTETTGLDLHHGAKPFFVTTCDLDGNQKFWEAEVDPLTREPLWSSDDLEQIEVELFEAHETVWQNPNFDITGLSTIIPRLKTEWNWKTTRCTLLADHLIKSNRRHDLTTQALVYLRTNIKKYEDAVEVAVKEARRLVKGQHPDWMVAKEGLACMPSAKDTIWKADMWLPRAVALAEDYEPDHPWWTVLEDYANVDSAVTIKIYQIQKEYLEEKDLWDIYLERLKVLPQRHKMEHRGITINKTRLEELENEYKEESETANQICNNIAKNYGFDLTLPKNGMNKSLTEFSFNVMKLPVVKKTDTGNPSFDKYAIEEYLATLPERSQQYTFVRTLGGKRSRDTAIGYMTSYRKYWKHRSGEWYNLHPSLNPTGTDTLRWSSQGPNEQQISKKEGFNLRYAFGPAPGREWWSLDYQNIELRIPAYESNERVMIDLFEKPDEPPFYGSNHLFNASVVYPELFWPISQEKGAFKKKYASTYYQWIKNFGFAVQYGAVEREGGTADRAAHRNGAHKLVMERLSEAKKLNQKWIDFANQWGYVETIPDQEINPRRGYPLYCPLTDRGNVLETIPLNYHVQGTACWVMMRAMDEVDQYLSTLNDCHVALQIHDELVIDMPYLPNGGNLPKVRKVKYLMERMGKPIGIPLTVGVEYHKDNWSVGVAA